MIISAIAIFISILSITFRGFNLGIDFTGGTLMELEFEKEPNIEIIRESLSQAGFKPTVQRLEKPTDILIRIAPQDEGTHSKDTTEKKSDEKNSGEEQNKKVQQQVVELLQAKTGSKASTRRVEFVGPQVGAELRDDGGIALLITLGAILVYVWIRYEKLLAAGAVLALIHDVAITLGMFSIFHIQFDLTVIAALLAVIGYSLNDTIVVFDRIRENFRRVRKGTPSEIANRSLNQTLSRTIMTSLTTWLVVISLAVFGGEAIRGFALALIIGIFVGTYSSIYIATYSALLFGIKRDDMLVLAKESEDQQG